MRSTKTKPPMTGARLQARMHIEAFAVFVVVVAVLVLTLGFTVLNGASDAVSSLAGLGIGIVGLCVGYGIALIRLFKETR